MRTDRKRPICESQAAKAIELTERYKKALKSVAEEGEEEGLEKPRGVGRDSDRGGFGMRKKEGKGTGFCWEKAAAFAACALLVALAAGCAAITIWCWASYGSKPIDEVPAWALLFMFGKN